MRVTKTMKNYVEKEFEKKRYAANAEYRKAYYERQDACSKELYALLDELREKSEAILAKYNMDSIKEKRENSDGYFSREIFQLYDQYIQNNEEAEDIRKHERKMLEYQRERLERFYLECDLGCDKEQFFAMVEALNFDEV